MKIICILLLTFYSASLKAQSFTMTDNILLYKITKREYISKYKKSQSSSRELFNGKKNPQMFFLITPKVINDQIKKVWGDYFFDDDFDWWYYELDTNDSNYKYMVIVEMPINPVAYLLDKDLQVDSTTIIGDGVLSKDNIYFTEQLYDSDETVHLNWYSINDGQVKHIAELAESSFSYRNICDGKLSSSFTDNNKNYYFAIENKMTHKRMYYRITLTCQRESFEDGALKHVLVNGGDIN